MKVRTPPSTKIGYRQSPLRVKGVPILSVLFFSVLPAMLPVIAKSPTMPPFGLMIFISWRLLQPNLWPVWIGIPLGFFDDLVSGQPLGSSIFLWTIIMLVFEAIEKRFIWRDYWMEWFLGSVALVFCIIMGLLFANLHGGSTHIQVILPQLLFSILFYPVAARICSWLDRIRLGR